MLGDSRRMRNIEFHNQRWWDRVKVEQSGAQAQQAPRAVREAAEAAAAAEAGPYELEAVEAMGDGRHGDALEALRRLLAPEGESAGWGAPARARGAARRASCLRRLHKLEEALVQAREAHELDAASPLVLFERGATLLDLGRCIHGMVHGMAHGMAHGVYIYMEHGESNISHTLLTCRHNASHRNTSHWHRHRHRHRHRYRYRSPRYPSLPYTSSFLPVYTPHLRPHPSLYTRVHSPHARTHLPPSLQSLPWPSWLPD